MTLIKSISGMRGTLGGQSGDNLTPLDIIEFTSAYGSILLKEAEAPTVVVGRDGRISGPQVEALVVHTLSMLGINVVNLGWSTTPTVEMEVLAQKAQGGIIITASHNDMRYNALKFLNEQGNFINASQGQEILRLAEDRSFEYASAHKLGTITAVDDAIQRHVDKITALATVKMQLIKERNFTIVVDCINSTGALAIPILSHALNCRYILINDEINGTFAHNPEPLEGNLNDLCQAVIEHQADLGIALDPDVDRLALVDENGQYCGEEYTLVMIAHYILQETPGPTVSNLSSTKALRDITERHGQAYYAAAVGEVNVVDKMMDVGAVIGGEGNGGVIYPTLHAGRDALVGIALIMSALCSNNTTLSKYRAMCPEYVMTKDKIQLTPELNVDALLSKVQEHYQAHELDTQDGVKIYIRQGWVHLRRSNTEPIIRIYSEGQDIYEAQDIAQEVKGLISKFI